MLRQSEIDPREPEGLLTVIVETILINPQYGEDRAIEMIREAQRTLQQSHGNPDRAKEAIDLYHRQMTNAITFLGLVRAVRLN